MRKLILITALMLASASAFAGETRSLTLASNDVTAVSTPTVDRTAIRQVSIKLAQAAAPATTQSDAAPALPQTTTTTTQTEAPAPAPVQAAAPATTTQPATTTTTADTKPAKPATKTTRRESDEQKARRIAARYGVHW